MQTLDILLMVSSFLLAVQYAVIAILSAKRQRNAVLPLSLLTLAFTIAGSVYLGVSLWRWISFSLFLFIPSQD